MNIKPTEPHHLNEWKIPPLMASSKNMCRVPESWSTSVASQFEFHYESIAFIQASSMLKPCIKLSGYESLWYCTSQINKVTLVLSGFLKSPSEKDDNKSLNSYGFNRPVVSHERRRQFVDINWPLVPRAPNRPPLPVILLLTSLCSYHICQHTNVEK